MLGKSQTNDEYKKKVQWETNVHFTSVQIGSDIEDDDDSPVAIGADLRDPKSDTQPTQPQRQVQKQNVESEPVVAASSSKVETPKVSMEEATRMLDERMSKFFDMIMSSKRDSESTSTKKKKNSLLPPHRREQGSQKWMTKN